MCIAGAKSRLGQPRPDMPWTDTEIDPAFLQWIKDFPRDIAPKINHLLATATKPTIRFTSRHQSTAYLATL